MNDAAREHLAEAKEYLTRGEEFYRKAAEKILAAQNEGATQREIGEEIGYSQYWVSNTLKWYLSPDREQITPYSEDTPRRGRDAAKQHLRDAPLEEVERIVADLPRERQQAIVAAVGQNHPALVTRPPKGRPSEQPSYGFTLEMAGPSQKLTVAVREYVEAWETHASEATEEELQIARDLVAPSLLSLRMTVEEMNVT